MQWCHWRPGLETCSASLLWWQASSALDGAPKPCSPPHRGARNEQVRAPAYPKGVCSSVVQPISFPRFTADTPGFGFCCHAVSLDEQQWRYRRDFPSAEDYPCGERAGSACAASQYTPAFSARVLRRPNRVSLGFPGRCGHRCWQAVPYAGLRARCAGPAGPSCSMRRAQGRRRTFWSSAPLALHTFARLAQCRTSSRHRESLGRSCGCRGPHRKSELECRRFASFLADSVCLGPSTYFLYTHSTSGKLPRCKRKERPSARCHIPHQLQARGFRRHT
mmetsp:Transcript_103020/g.197787  ORF Transcript_103020/g.197787 Transcript_103020/m.197787 type:complete len:277 (-) Transcript_103020:1282-2112(-)